MAKKSKRNAPVRRRAPLRGASSPTPTPSYAHPEATTPLRPEAGTQPQFRKKKPPATYRYDSSLAPEMEWDGQNPARELGEWLLARIEEASRLPAPHTFAKPRELKGPRGDVVATVRSLAEAVAQLKRIERPFLDWAGKAERQSFDVPTLPLFVHERLSTKAILETLKAHRRDHQLTMFDLYGDPQHSVTDQVLKAYEHQDKWQNRMILGDSLVVMNSLLKYEGLGGQVQMIYMDPPYGIKFGSNFQPFVRKRDVKHNDDEDMTREPEMVKAYRDTWELGLHSYLTYMRDRLLLARELLTPTGSVFVQISDENVHHVRELLDDVFGPTCFEGQISFFKTTTKGAGRLDSVCDVILWYSRLEGRAKYHPLFVPRGPEEDYNLRWVEWTDGRRERLRTASQVLDAATKGARVFRPNPITSTRAPGASDLASFEFEGKKYSPGQRTFQTNAAGMQRLAGERRLLGSGNTLQFIRYLDDFPFKPINNIWDDTRQSGFSEEKVYVVQTSPKVIARCVLMTTDPGDLVLDPTCGSGTTAYVAEQWGRRWITIDTSRVPLALARQRLLTGTFAWYELLDDARGPAGGFVYKRRQNSKGEEIGGIVPHVTLQSIANDEPPKEETLVDRPETSGKVTRVTGPFVVEATIPTPIDLEEPGSAAPGLSPPVDHGSFVDRMIEVLRLSPVLHLGGNKTVTLSNIRPPARTRSLNAEGVVANGNGGQAVAVVFGPENGAVSESTVYAAAQEAHAKQYRHLYVVGFAIQPNARNLVDQCEAVVGIPATYVQATPDLMMGDLLKNMRSSQIFSVCGLPEVKLRAADPRELERVGVQAKEKGWFQVDLLGLDVFDPSTLQVDHRKGDDVPCWMLDADYNGLCFKAAQVFFPRTGAWEDLKRALSVDYDETVWDHLAGSTSAPFQLGEHRQVAVKVIDLRGNELLVVKGTSEDSR